MREGRMAPAVGVQGEWMEAFAFSTDSSEHLRPLLRVFEFRATTLRCERACARVQCLACKSNSFVTKGVSGGRTWSGARLLRYA